MDDDRPYVIKRPNSPGRQDGYIHLRADAIEWARQHGMSLKQMARHLLNQHTLQESGSVQGQAVKPVTSEAYPGLESAPYNYPVVPFDRPMTEEGDVIP